MANYGLITGSTIVCFNMKKLLLLLFSLILSFNSYSEWTEFPPYDSEERYFIDFDNLQERSDGYVYWWMMVSYSNSSEKYYWQTDCEAERINPLQGDLHTEPMGGGEVTSFEPDEGWTYPAPDTGLYRFVEVVCEMAREAPEERENSVANLLMELEYMYKINNLSEEAEAEKQLEFEKEYNYTVGVDSSQLNDLKSAYINNIAARIKTFWRYQSAEDDWSAEVYIVQDRDGNVKAVDVQGLNISNNKLAKSFMDSIERAVNKASPLPGAPNEAVFDKELYFIFTVK